MHLQLLPVPRIAGHMVVASSSLASQTESFSAHIFAGAPGNAVLEFTTGRVVVEELPRTVGARTEDVQAVDTEVRGGKLNDKSQRNCIRKIGGVCELHDALRWRCDARICCRLGESSSCRI